jgi:uncharacterized protein (TIGR02217 family)
MSNLVFPSTLAGFLVGDREQIEDNQVVQTSLSGKEWRSTWELAPRYRYKVSFPFLRSTTQPEFQQLAGFFTRHRGSLDSFLFQDPEDSVVTGHAFGVGNGSTTAYQLQRTLVPDVLLNPAATRTYWSAMGDGYEPCWDLASAPNIYVAGVLKTAGVDYTLGVNGAITFTAAPANGAALTWDGNYWRRVRFAAANLPLSRSVQYLWAAKTTELISVNGGGGNTYVLPPAGVVFSPVTPPTPWVDSGLLY